MSVAPAPMLAQSQPAPLGFAYSYSVFALDDTSSLVELDYEYSDRGLTYERVDGRRLGRLMVTLEVWDSTDRPILLSSWITASEEPSNGAESNLLMGVKLFGIRHGRHRARISYEDVGAPHRRDSADFELNVRRFPPGSLALSDVQLINEITPSEDTENRFYKNGYVVYPNVLSYIEPPFLLLNTYLEVYNANTVPTSQYEIVYALADSTGTMIYQKEQKRDRPTAAAVTDVHSLVLEELPSGPYFLLVKAYAGLAGSAADSAMVVRQFTLSNPDKDSLMAAARASHGGGLDMELDPSFAGLTEAELDAEFARLKHITVDAERDIWEKLTGADAKGRFLTGFWTRRDPTPGTTVNEFRNDYQQRIESANAMYREPLVAHGYLTDRGRVLLKYGKPDQVERRYFDKNRRPYEIWGYSKDHAVFVFVDRTGLGRFVLVHSENAPGEVRQEDWERRYATVHEYFDN